MSLIFSTFTAIAWRPRELGSGAHDWRPIDTAPLTMQEAHALADAGNLLIASRHFDNVIHCVVKSPMAVIKGERRGTS